jgi:glycerol-3-phosphate acyltransferase PlsX
MEVNMVTIALDGMGGDYAPGSVVDGILKYLEKGQETVSFIITGLEEKIKPLFPQSKLPENVKIVPSSEVFAMDEKPSLILKRTNTSLHKAAALVRDREADALISAGNTGGLLAAATFLIGRIKGVKRPALITPIPNLNRDVLLLDSGATVECSKEILIGFTRMSIAFLQVIGRSDYKIGLLNVGTEEDKGTEEIKEAYSLMKEKFGDSFYGFVEGRDINLGKVDVIVTDGFSGNIALKAMEGTAKFILETLKDEIKKGGLRAKIGALLLKPALVLLKQRFDPHDVGGAFILGVNAPVVKAHGNSNGFAISNAIRVAIDGVKNRLVENIAQQYKEAE